MSLMLRKQCQKQLDDAGLHNYHVDIQQNSYGGQKNLVVVGECGQPFITLHGVSFAKLAPTRAEIDFADELLGDFLATHKLKIEEYIKTATEFKQKDEVHLEQPNGTIRVEHGYGSVKGGVSYEDGLFRVTLDKEGAVERATLVNNEEVLSFDDATKARLSKKAYEEAIAYRESYYQYAQERELVEDLKRALSKCEI